MSEIGEVLRGRRVMIVEDEMLVAMELESIVADQGCNVVGPAPTVKRALCLIEAERPEVAILDVNLNGTTAAPIAAALKAKHVPFILASGYGEGQALQPELKGVPRVDKPVDYRQLVRALIEILSDRPPA